MARTLFAKALAPLDADKLRVAGWIAGRPDPAVATDDELRTTIAEFQAMFRPLFARHISTTFSATIPTGVLTDLCTNKLGDPGLVVQLLGGIGEVESAEPPCHLWRLGRLVADDATLTAAFDAGLDGLVGRLHTEPVASLFLERMVAFQERFGATGPERVGGLVADVGHRAQPRPRRRRRHAQGRPRSTTPTASAGASPPSGPM